MSTLRDRAVEVLQANWTGTSTLPSRDQYPHQWSWDSAFISIGLARVAPDHARAELMSLFRSQWKSGRVPQIVFHAGDDAYFPGPEFWRAHDSWGRATSGLVQPPIHARAALSVHLADPVGSARERFLDRLYPQLSAWHRYLLGSRDVGGGGLAAIVHPWESGLDNSPAWDFVLAGAALPDDHEFVRRDVRHVEPAHRPTNDDYRAYVALATSYRDSGYDDTTLADHTFVVEDPLFNSLLVDAEICMARIAEVLGAESDPHLQRARTVHMAMIDRLWDDARHMFTARDVRSARSGTIPTVGSLLPLLSPWLPDDVRDAVGKLAASDAFVGGCRFPVPSTAITADEFDRRRYWRGPTWANTNWLMWVAATQADLPELADRIAAATIELVVRAGFREYFDPVSGAGLGASAFSWTAALTLDLLAATHGDTAVGTGHTA